MRVAILNRDRAWWPGGDLVEIDNRIAALAKLGVECVYEPLDLTGFDVVHVFHSNFDWSLANMERAWAYNIPYVVTPIFYPNHKGTKGHGSAERIAEDLREAAAVMPFSRREAEEIARELGALLVREVDIIPNGTSPDFHAEDGFSRSGVCTVVARTPDVIKNSGLIKDACALAGLPYEQICGIAPAEMPAAYRRFKVFVSASKGERMSLVVGEALCSGCRVLSTIENRGNEWYPGLQTINPAMTPKALSALLSVAYRSEEWDWRPNEAARELTWDRCAAATLKVYEKAIKCHASQ